MAHDLRKATGRRERTWSSPYFMTVSFLLRPWSAPYMRSFNLQDLCTVKSFWPVMSMTSFSVCWARFNSLVYATSNANPSFQIHVAPAAASFFPNIVKGTSAQPVNKFLAFHSDWPCLTKQTLHVAASFQAILTVLRLVVVRVGSLGCRAHAAVARRRARILALHA